MKYRQLIDFFNKGLDLEKRRQRILDSEDLLLSQDLKHEILIQEVVEEATRLPVSGEALLIDILNGYKQNPVSYDVVTRFQQDLARGREELIEALKQIQKCSL